MTMSELNSRTLRDFLACRIDLDTLNGKLVEGCAYILHSGMTVVVERCDFSMGSFENLCITDQIDTNHRSSGRFVMRPTLIIFRGCNFSNSSFQEAHMEIAVRFLGCDLRDVNFSGVRYRELSLAESKISGLDLRKTEGKRLILARTNVQSLQIQEMSAEWLELEGSYGWEWVRGYTRINIPPHVKTYIRAMRAYRRQTDLTE